MSISVHAATPGEAVVEMAGVVRRNGLVVNPRGFKTFEVIAPELRIECPWMVDELTLGIANRGLNPTIGALEALQLVGQTAVPDMLMDKVPAFTKYQDDGIFWGAYGQRIYGQLAGVVRALQEDLDTRQAVVTIFDGHRDPGRPVKDIPCTIALQFLFRDGRLILRTMMRSNDVWLGLPYDIIQFCALQGAVAAALDVPMGPYLHTATSMHLYDRDIDKTITLVDTSSPREYQPLWSGNNIGDISRMARDILGGKIEAAALAVTNFELSLYKAVNHV